MRLSLTVDRFDPETDAGPWSQRFTLDWQRHETVLDLLHAAQRQEPALAFRRSCRSGICGSCAVVIAGRARLACQTLVRDVAVDGGTLSVGPLAGFRRLRDLVVDLDPFFDALLRGLPWVILRPDHDGRVSPEAAARIEPPACCILCGVCDAELPRGGALTPAALVKSVRLAVDPRDRLAGERLRIAGLTEEGQATFRELLAAVCPKGIRLPAVAVE